LQKGYPVISVITVCYNAERTIENAIRSVLSQKYPNVEYLVVDGRSTDRSLQIIDTYRSKISRVVSEKDAGMYDAINKGIALATGDVIGLLHADDVFDSDRVLETIALSFSGDPEVQAVIGDVCFENNSGKTVRYYSAKNWSPSKLRLGFMPPHPSFYCKKECFERYGGYRLDFEIASDYELLIRFLQVNELRYKYLPVLMVRMGMGGKSTKSLKSNLIINKEIVKACKLNGLSTNYFLLYFKYFTKIKEFF